MPMFGVMRLTFDEDDESMSGDDDFFSVARTIPLVAEVKISWEHVHGHGRPTLDSQGRNTLVDCVQGILYWVVSSVPNQQLPVGVHFRHTNLH